MTALSNQVSEGDDAAEPTRVRMLGRAAAVLAVGSAVVHLLLFDASQLGSIAMLGMAMACLPCVWHLWRSPTARVWALTAAMDATMLAFHAQLLAAEPTHVHSAAGAGHATGGLMWFGFALVAGQLTVAALSTVRG